MAERLAVLRKAAENVSECNPRTIYNMQPECGIVVATAIATVM